VSARENLGKKPSCFLVNSMKCKKTLMIEDIIGTI
jgi:hypothetical protein